MKKHLNEEDFFREINSEIFSSDAISDFLNLSPSPELTLLKEKIEKIKHIIETGKEDLSKINTQCLYIDKCISIIKEINNIISADA